MFEHSHEITFLFITFLIVSTKNNEILRKTKSYEHDEFTMFNEYNLSQFQLINQNLHRNNKQQNQMIRRRMIINTMTKYNKKKYS